MRLIDADELRWTSLQDGFGRINTCIVFESDINAMPKVDAIPIEWIEKWLDEFLGTKLEEEITDLDPFKKNVYQGILLMYNDWRRGDEIEEREI